MASAGQQQGPFHLLAIPLEILTEIANNLTDSPLGLRGLAYLGRTCSALFILVTPVLYRHIHLYIPLYPMLAKLAHSLAASPARCEHIQSINIRRIYKDGFFTQSDREILDTIMQPLFGIHPFEPSNLDNADLATMAVICLAPNLETLEIGHFERSGNTDSLLQEVNNRVRQRSPCTLSKLTTLTFKPPFKKAKINLDKLNGLLHAAPNLQSLHIDAAIGGSSRAVSLTNLTTLCLENSHLGYQGVRLLTQPCVNLKYFKFAHFKSLIDDSTWLPFSAAQILECLEPCSARLQHLHLEPLASLDNYVIEDEDGVHFPLLTSLRGFPALRQVAVDPLAITPRSDGQGGLADLLRDCPALEGILLIDVKEVTSVELESIAHAVVDLMLWPQLSMIKFQAHAQCPPWDYTRMILERLQTRLLSDEADSNASKIRWAGVDLLVVEGNEIYDENYSVDEDSD